jgi:hypothetical protein
MVLACWLVAGATGATQQLPLEPLPDSGGSVTPAYEGWFRNPDGTYSLLLGYFNRNQKQTVDVSTGPENSIEPGGPDQGQPTHFNPHRQLGVFAIVVPADFGTKKLTWTLTANGQTMSVPLALNPLSEVSPLKDPGTGNTPPILKFDPNGRAFQGPPIGPPRGIATSLTARVGEPTTLTVWASDDAVVDPNHPTGDMPLTVHWSRFRGPGVVRMTTGAPAVDPKDGRASTVATFLAPGEYVMRVQANDASGEGGGGFQCCWTSALVKVVVSDDVKPGQ